MCGIAGIANLRGQKPQAELVKQMCDLLSHRGPDDEGYYRGNEVVLGNRRLSIIDLSGGHQPISNEDKTVWVTLNGEIYNFQELRTALEKRGHRFATSSDTEVIVHAYEDYGEECLSQFRGMFAFALWDERKKQLFLARDRVGKKPLFYTNTGREFVFASELQALVKHPAVGKEVDETAIDEYLTYGYVPAPRTIFKRVYKIPPAHYLTLELAKNGESQPEIAMQRYWKLDYNEKLDLTEEEAAEAILEQLKEAVRLRMVADVPLGALLSGGTDSSIVVALMSQMSSRPVKTFSIGFNEQEFNELSHASRVARLFHTEHHEMVVTPNTLEVLPALVRHYGEPFADSSAVPTYYVAKLTRQHVTVALNGDGGDECFAGYERYLGAMLANQYQKIPRIVRKVLIGPFAAALPETSAGRSPIVQARRFFEAAEQPFADRYLRWVTYFTLRDKRKLYSRDFSGELKNSSANSWLLNLFSAVQVNGSKNLDTLLAVDVHSYLPYDLLVKMDIATMANSLEARSPFLDHKLMEFCARLPSRFKLRHFRLKYLLKKVGKKLLPSENLYRRKMGFGVPVGAWLKNELRPLLEDLLLGERLKRRGYFEAEAVRELVQRHMSGLEDQTFKLWALLWLELWHREFVD